MSKVIPMPHESDAYSLMADFTPCDVETPQNKSAPQYFTFDECSEIDEDSCEIAEESPFAFSSKGAFISSPHLEAIPSVRDSLGEEESHSFRRLSLQELVRSIRTPHL